MQTDQGTNPLVSDHCDGQVKRRENHELTCTGFRLDVARGTSCISRDTANHIYLLSYREKCVPLLCIQSNNKR